MNINNQHLDNQQEEEEEIDLFDSMMNAVAEIFTTPNGIKLVKKPSSPSSEKEKEGEARSGGEGAESVRRNGQEDLPASNSKDAYKSKDAAKGCDFMSEDVPTLKKHNMEVDIVGSLLQDKPDDCEETKNPEPQTEAGLSQRLSDIPSTGNVCLSSTSEKTECPSSDCLTPATVPSPTTSPSHTSDVKYVCDKRFWQCPLCDFLAYSPGEFYAHTLRLHKIKCEHCEKHFIEVFTLHEHQARQHGVRNEGIFQCPFCKEFISRKSGRAISKHFQKHSVINDIRCDPCKLKFLTKNHLWKHMILEHQEGNLMNKQEVKREGNRKACEETINPEPATEAGPFQMLSGIPSKGNHTGNNCLSSASEKTECSSSDCLTTATAPSPTTPTLNQSEVGEDKFEGMLKSPSMSTNEEGAQSNIIDDPYGGTDFSQCPLCDFLTPSASNLHTHSLKLHESKCKYCEKRFVSLFELNEHQAKSHDKWDDRYCQCPFCKRLISKKKFNKHVQKHSLIRSFMCDQCQLSFVTKRNLWLHNIVEHREGKQQVNQEDTPQEKQSNEQKKDTHKFDDSKLACTKCKETFKTAGLFRRHMRLGCKQEEDRGISVDAPKVERKVFEEKETESAKETVSPSNEGCKRMEHMKTKGICKFRIQGCRRMDCKFAHEFPAHLIFPLYCEPFFHGQCDEGSERRRNCVKLHHVKYGSLNKLFLKKLGWLASNCELCKMATKFMHPGKLGIQIKVRNEKEDQQMQDNEDTPEADLRETETSEGSTKVEETKEIRLLADLDDPKPPAPELVVRERKVFDDDLIVQERLALDSNEDMDLNNTTTQGSRLLEHEPQSHFSVHVQEVSPEESTEELWKEPMGPAPMSFPVREIGPKKRAHGEKKEHWVPVPISFNVREVSPEERSEHSKSKPGRRVPVTFHPRETSPEDETTDLRGPLPVTFHVREISPEDRAAEPRGPVHQRLGQRETWSNSSFSRRAQTSGGSGYLNTAPSTPRSLNEPQTSSNVGRPESDLRHDESRDFAIFTLQLRNLLFLQPGHALGMSDFNKVMQWNKKWKNFGFSKWADLLDSTGLITIDRVGQSKEIRLLSKQHQIALEAFKSNSTKLLLTNSPLKLDNFGRLYCDQFTLQFHLELCETTLLDRVKQIPKIKLVGKDKRMLSLSDNNERPAPQEGSSPSRSGRGEASVDQQQAETRTPCYFFHQKGRCRNGQNCKYSH